MDSGLTWVLTTHNRTRSHANFYKQTLVVRVNSEKGTVALRNRRLAELAHSRIGDTTSRVYAELLRSLEDGISRCRADPTLDDPDDNPTDHKITTNELNLAISRSIDLSKGIGDPTHAKEKRPHAHEAEVENGARSDDDGSDKEVEMNGNGAVADNDVVMANASDDPFADNEPSAKKAKVTFATKAPKQKPKQEVPEQREERLFCLKRHLQLLAEDSCHFVRKRDNEWTVDFKPLVELLRESELDKLILESFGQGGHRLVRMLRKMGKLEEKALPNLALMKQKDIRTKMAEMHMAGIVDIQEVPRDTSRATARMIFLWYFDYERASSILLESAYKTMSRCLQRLEIERRRASGILAVAERTDVRATSEGEVLDESQLKLLSEIRATEAQLLGQVFRLDELVGVFRDY